MQPPPHPGGHGQYPPPQQSGFTPPPAGSYGYAPRPPPQVPGEAIGALICGLMAWSCFPLGFVAIWLGARARRMAKENPGSVGGEGMALAGMITGGVIGGGMLLLWILYFGFFAAMFGLTAVSSP